MKKARILLNANRALRTNVFLGWLLKAGRLRVLITLWRKTARFVTEETIRVHDWRATLSMNNTASNCKHTRLGLVSPGKIISPDMEASGSKPKTKIHKPGISKNFPANNHYQETSRNRIFARRDSTPELGLNGFSFRPESRTSSTEVPSYNLWKSRLDRRNSLPNCTSFGQRKHSTSSGVFVPSVFTRETKGLRKYTTSLGSTFNENDDQKIEETAGNDGEMKDVVTNRIAVLSKERTWQQIFSRESSAISRGANSYSADSVSSLRCTSREPPSARRGERQQAYYAKNDRIKRWLSEVE